MVKVGIIGVGTFGTNVLKTFSQLEKQNLCKLVAICDINENLLEKQSRDFNVKGYTDYKEMIEKEEMDGVAIVTPDPFHKEPAIFAANKGKHIFVEKPMDTTVEGCLEMIEAAEKNNVFLQVDFHKRFDPFHKEIKKDIKEGKIGKVEYGYVHMEDKIVVPRDWFPKWAPQSSPVWFLGVHFFDLLRWFLESNGKSVYATGRKWKLKKMGIDTYDSVNCIVEFENGASISFDLSWILPENFESIVNQGFRLVGEDGVIECDSQDRGTRVYYEKEGVKTYNPVFISEIFDERENSFKYSGYGIDSIADFVYNLTYLEKGGSIEKIKEGISATGIDGLEVTKIAVAVHKSLESGKVEKI